MNTLPIRRNRIDEIINARNYAQRALELSERLYNAAFSRLTDVLGSDGHWRYGIEYSGGRGGRVAVDEMQGRITREIWHYLANHAGIQNLMSVGDWKKLNDQIDQDEMPEMTAETIFEYLMQISGNLGVFMQRAVAEAFEELVPRSNHGESFKTCTYDEVGPKVIQEWWMSASYFKGCEPDLRYEAEQKIRIVDNAFHLLDGKGPLKGAGLVEAIKEQMTKNRHADSSNGTVVCREVQTGYFRVKWFKNGNIHLWIKRDDLRQKMNEIGGKMRLQNRKGAAA